MLVPVQADAVLIAHPAAEQQAPMGPEVMVSWKGPLLVVAPVHVATRMRYVVPEAMKKSVMVEGPAPPVQASSLQIRAWLSAASGQMSWTVRMVSRLPVTALHVVSV